MVHWEFVKLIARDCRTLVVVDQSVATLRERCCRGCKQEVAVAMLTIEATGRSRWKQLVAFLMRPSPTEWIAGSAGLRWRWDLGDLVDVTALHLRG